MITHDEFMQGVYDFMNEYDRLPYLPGDNIKVKFEIEDDNGNTTIKIKPYRANRYVKSFIRVENMTKNYWKKGY